jgi:50S ribosomal protein L16 3-hydroxylase
MKDQETPVLDALLPALSGRDFVEKYWCQRPFVCHGDPGRLPEIFGCAAVEDLPAVLRSNRGSDIRVWFTNDKNENRPVRVDAQQAALLYTSRKVTVVVDKIDPWVPPVASLVERLARELASPMLGVGCNVYASPVGIGTRMHFDEQEVFLLQLRGSKRWHYAPVEQIRFPTRAYFGGRVDPELALVTEGFPDELPLGYQETVLRPGSVLFLPRGTWHASETVESDSLALTLTFASATWADIFIASLRRWMVQNESWRSPAARGLDPHRERELQDTIDLLLSGLRSGFLEEPMAERFRSSFGVCGPAGRRFRVAPDTRLVMRQGRPSLKLDVIRGGTRKAVLNVGNEYRGLLRRIIEKGDPFSPDEVADASIGSTETSGVLAYLLKEGVLQVMPAR